MSRSVTVVVPAHAGEEALLALLGSLDRQVAGEPLRVIVSDDASPAPLEESIRAESFPSLDLRVARSETSGGPGAARNRGLALVDTPWVAFLDSDELAGEGWVERLESIAAGDEPPDAVEGRIVVGPDPPTPFTHVARASAEGGEHVAGNVAYRTDVLRDLGGFDERYFDPGRKLHFREDADLYLRLREHGKRIEHDPDLLAVHPPRPASFWDPVKDARRYAFDPLLSREHPDGFRELMRSRKLGPVPLRRARHVAAQAHALGAVALVAGLASRRDALAAGGGALLAAAWTANAAALAHGRRVPLRLVPQVAAASFLTPWVYLWSYYRGCALFAHLPRL